MGTAPLTGVQWVAPTNWLYGHVSQSEALVQYGTWRESYPFNLTCGGTPVGPANPELCLDRVEVVLTSPTSGNVTTVTFNATQMDEFRAVSLTNPDEYVFPLPLFKYAEPSVYYDAESLVVFHAASGETKNGTLVASTFNPFNASASSIREYYGIPPSATGSNRVAQASSLLPGGGTSGVNISVSDQFMSLQGLEADALRFPVWAPLNDPKSANPEAIEEYMLDVTTQYSTAPQAITYAIPTVLPIAELEQALLGTGLSDGQIERALQAVEWANPGNTPSENLTALLELGEMERQAVGEFYTEYLRAFAKNLTDSQGVTPSVMSWSWNTGFYRAAGVPLQALEDWLKTMSLAGVTLFVASGDNGASSTEEACRPPGNPLNGNQYDAWPIVSPWVTAVGGTQFLGSDEVVVSATTDGGCTSGGGFAGFSYPSELYETPEWQKKAVESYLARTNRSTFSGFPSLDTPGFNPGGRAYPDISMFSAGIGQLRSYDREQIFVASGTSYGAPLAASFFALANDDLLQAGYQTIGYANPMLYWMAENCPDVFNDVTIGNNQATKESPTDCLFGFPAAPGWDAATGLGSINFDPFVFCAKRYQDEVRSKDLELLPDGTFNTAAASSANGGSDQSQRPNTRSGVSSMVLTSRTMLFLWAAFYIL